MIEHCPRCGMTYTAPWNSSRRKSRDHILPRERGAGNGSMIHGDVRNVEIMCQECNSLRAACGHCWGAVACVLAISENRAVGAATMQRWMAARGGDRVIARRAKAAEAVKIGMIVQRVGRDEFLYPADTAAKRVWNMITLERGKIPASWFKERDRRWALEDAEKKANF